MMKVGMVGMVANKDAKNSYIVRRWLVPFFGLDLAGGSKMKKLITWGLIINLTLLTLGTAFGCQQEPPPPPPPPALAPVPTPPPEPSPPPPEVKVDVEVLEVLRMHGWVNGSEYWIEGTVKNTGDVQLYDVRFEVSSFDKDNNLISKISAPLEPSTIEVWKTAYCGVKFQQESDLIKTFRYRFTLASGEEITVRN